MIHPKLRLAAAKFALDLATESDLVDAAHAALDDAIYADGLAVIVTTRDISLCEAKPHFTAALRELGHAFTSQDDALRCVRLGYFGPIGEGIVSPADGLSRYREEVQGEIPSWEQPKFAAWNSPPVGGLVSQWYRYDDFAGAYGVPLAHPNAAEAMKEWNSETVQLCREWCREYASLYFQPAWRSPTVLALASAIHADRAFDRLPILADALEEAGCDHPDLLAHCRTPNPHTDYCWLVDVLLGSV